MYNLNKKKETNCYCEDCVANNAVDLAANYANQLLLSESVHELELVLFDLIEHASIEGMKEYLFHESADKADVLRMLDEGQVDKQCVNEGVECVKETTVSFEEFLHLLGFEGLFD